MTIDLNPHLLDLERNFWTGDSKFFAEHTDASCLVAFPEMALVMRRDDLAETARDGNRWRDLRIDVKGVIEPADGVLILTYEARAVRTGGEPYAALVSTGYVKRAEGWKMMFHAHAPLDAPAATR